MLKQIFNIIKSIGDAIVTGFAFIVGFFKDIAEVVKAVGEAVVTATKFVDKIIPVELIGIVLVLIGITVVYRITGRD